MVLMSAAEAERRGAAPLARIVSWAHAGVDPAIMGTGPIPASRRALELAGWSTDDLDLVEANEAFAAQACAVNKDVGWDTDKVNVNGGAIALGHPDRRLRRLAILVTLLHEMQKPRCKERARDPVYRRRHGHRHVCGARLIAKACQTASPAPASPAGRTPLSSGSYESGGDEICRECGRNGWHARNWCCDFEGTQGCRLQGGGDLWRQRRGREQVQRRNRHSGLQMGREQLCGLRGRSEESRGGSRSPSRSSSTMPESRATAC